MTGRSPPVPPTGSRTPRRGGVVALGALAVVLVVVGALYADGIGPFAPASTPPTIDGSAGGFAQGQAVTLDYSGSSLCAPATAQFYPDARAVNSTTPCEVGDADQTAVINAVPQWLLVPAFAGLSAFGDVAAGATSQGYPLVAGNPLLTDCPAGTSASHCPQTPATIYSPAYAAVEQFANLTAGIDGLALGVLPMPAHDILINSSTQVSPPIPWGTVIVLVFDPNIFPARSNGACAATQASNLTIPTGNCLTTLEDLDRALVTSSSAVPGANGAATNNPVWKALGGPMDQVYVANDPTVAAVDHGLNSDLYQTYGVSPTLPTFADA